eukprot:m.175293 g.175293  ORF g.175293 m.175293 type:complete len:520 (+) comp13966_c0_seq1:71-1630(+)
MRRRSGLPEGTLNGDTAAAAAGGTENVMGRSILSNGHGDSSNNDGASSAVEGDSVGTKDTKDAKDGAAALGKRRRSRARTVTFSEYAAKVSARMSRSPTKGGSHGSGALEGVIQSFEAAPDETEMDLWMQEFERKCVRELEREMALETKPGYSRTTTFAFMDITPFLRSAVDAILRDSFTKCFESKDRVKWDNTFYLFPVYWVGIFLRYFVLFPFRLVIVILGLSFAVGLVAVAAFLSDPWKGWLQNFIISFTNMLFLFSWCAVIVEKGDIPPREPGQIYVANHSSVVDICFLLKRQKYSITGQKHGGFIGFFQNNILNPLGCLWFNRMQRRDRELVSELIKEHSMDISKPPLLVFPEGTCVNNEYVVMFKRGAFELGKSIVPVAIKYNKVFVDPYWNSRTTSFLGHLLRLMTTWAVVCEITYLDPQYRRRGESSIAFATRVKEMIADAAGLTPVPWDGLLKYRTPRPEIKARRCRIYLNIVRQRFGRAAAAADSVDESPSPETDNDSPTSSPPESPPR